MSKELMDYSGSVADPKSELKGTPLSISQERLWVLDQLHLGNAAQNLACGLRFTGGIHRAALNAAVDEVVQRYENLRTEFHSLGGAPLQFVLSSARLAVKAVDLLHVGPQEREAELLRLAQAEVQKSFDLTRGPLLRATVFELNDTQHVFLLVTHRIVCDGASLKVLLSEVGSRYQTQLSGELHGLADKAAQYRELAARNTAPSPAHLHYWKQCLKGVPSTIDLPIDRQRPLVQTFPGDRQRMCIEPVERLRQLGENHGIDLFTILLAAFDVLLFRYSRQDDVVIGTRVSGRGTDELETLIGPLENLLALRTDVSGDPTFAELLVRVREVSQEAFSHQDVPFATLVKELHLEHDMSRHPLFQILFTIRDASVAASMPTLPGLSLFELENPAQEFDLSVEFAIKENQLEAAFGYNADLFDAATIGRMMGHFQRLLASAAEHPSIKISRMPLLSEAERQQLLVEWNDTRVENPPVQCVHERFEAQVERTPNAVAVSYESVSLTYGELNQRANQLAHYLRKLGVGPDSRVGICLERGFEMVIGLLAVLKAGGAYVPLDPAYPSERLQFMLDDGAPAVLLTQKDLRGLFEGIREELPVLDLTTGRAWDLEPETNPDRATVGVTPGSVAYVIYTSGSTGTPKGVMVEHANVVRLFTSTDAWFQFSGSDAWSLFHSYAFDFSVWEIWGALFYGGRLIIVPKDVARSPDDFYELLCREKVTVLNQTPSAFRQLISAQGKSNKSHQLRYVVFGGEALETAMLKPWYEQNQGRPTRLINMYGITETTVHVTYRPLTQADTERRGGSPVGCRIPDLRIYIMDDHRQPVPIGVVGELYVGGAGVARGYLNRPELTEERFIKDPFVEDAAARMYKTGDLGRWLANGEIEFFGRNDSQVKIRGFRIELGEIEARLAEQFGVQEAVVIAREDGTGDKRLVAYYTPADGGEEISAEKLRALLSASLPEYMVPAAYVRLESLPLTTNGKLDRKALPAPEADAYGVRAYEAPAGEMEEKLAKIWAEVLRVERVGRRDNFFALGGHSLMAARMLSQVKEMVGRQIPLSALFRNASVDLLAQFIQRESQGDKDPVVMEIQHGDGSLLPFFAIVPPGEESLGYAMLARHMGPSQTVYKIQGHAPIVDPNRPYSKQEMDSLAEEYAAAMRSVQPYGPYCLGGLCDGTHIAEQIVLKLEAQGEEIGLFAIFDTWVMQHSQIRWLWKLDYYRQRLRQVNGMRLRERLATYKSLAEKKVDLLLGKTAPRTDWEQTYWPEDFTPPRFRAPVVLFKRPKQQFYYISDPQMGWGRRSETGVEVHEIDFNHLEILREPHVRQFGETLAQCIARVSQRIMKLDGGTEDQQPLASVSIEARLRS
jgi:amino acid adenylation domain-containing protein